MNSQIAKMFVFLSDELDKALTLDKRKGWRIRYNGKIVNIEQFSPGTNSPYRCEQSALLHFNLILKVCLWEWIHHEEELNHDLSDQIGTKTPREWVDMCAHDWQTHLLETGLVEIEEFDEHEE